MRDKESKYLPLSSTPQPRPSIVKGGDCGLCCISGIYNISVDEAYKLYGKYDSIDYNDLITILKTTEREHIEGLPKLDLWYQPDKNLQFWAFGQPGCANSYNWYQRTKELIDDGYVGMCTINFEGKGNEKYETNHWVLITGYQSYWRKLDTSSSVQDTFVEISCSVKGKYELYPHEFLKHYGGYNAVFIKLN